MFLNKFKILFVGFVVVFSVMMCMFILGCLRLLNIVLVSSTR